MSRRDAFVVLCVNLVRNIRTYIYIPHTYKYCVLLCTKMYAFELLFVVETFTTDERRLSASVIEKPSANKMT